eukprot:TRINITY_DN10678_c0_g3_i1.p1 TRINITY_DN10678_c0_g3~~TRINITY_DN10678_c0_g3_i1.p1  ORF type:complete len:683 (+),score=292.26 TRINITY_DN10678_c0_g3_i1:168-2216(+)
MAADSFFDAPSPQRVRTSLVECNIHPDLRERFESFSPVFLRVVEKETSRGRRLPRVAVLSSEALFLCGEDGSVKQTCPLRRVGVGGIELAGDAVVLHDDGTDVRLHLADDPRNLDAGGEAFAAALRVVAADAGGKAAGSPPRPRRRAGTSPPSICTNVREDAVRRMLSRSGEEDAEAVARGFCDAVQLLQAERPEAARAVRLVADAAERCDAGRRRAELEAVGLRRRLENGGCDQRLRERIAELERAAEDTDRAHQRRISDLEEQMSAFKTAREPSRPAPPSPAAGGDLAAARVEIELLNEKLYELRARYREADEIRERLEEVERERDLLRQHSSSSRGRAAAASLSVATSTPDWEVSAADARCSALSLGWRETEPLLCPPPVLDPPPPVLEPPVLDPPPAVLQPPPAALPTQPTDAADGEAGAMEEAGELCPLLTAELRAFVRSVDERGPPPPHQPEPASPESRFGPEPLQRDEPARQPEPLRRDEPARQPEPLRRDEAVRRPDREPLRRSEPLRRDDGGVRRREPLRRDEAVRRGSDSSPRQPRKPAAKRRPSAQQKQRRPEPRTPKELARAAVAEATAEAESELSSPPPPPPAAPPPCPAVVAGALDASFTERLRQAGLDHDQQQALRQLGVRATRHLNFVTLSELNAVLDGDAVRCLLSEFQLSADGGDEGQFLVRRL